MYNKENVMQQILSLDQLIISEQKKNQNHTGLKRLQSLIDIIKGVGMVQGAGIDKENERYFLIDGISWQKACEELHQAIIPNFIMWEESDFFVFLESLLRGSDKPKRPSTKR
jgi:hypothetical protein